MSLALAFASGLALGALCWFGLRPSLGREIFQRDNYRGHRLPTAAGIVLPAAMLVAQALVAVAGAARPTATAVLEWLADEARTGTLVLLVALGFALLGLFDDLGGDGDRRGFRGHLASLARGAPTTGAVKLVGGGAVGLAAAASQAPSLTAALRDGAIVALAANVGNLFDRAPGRATKVSLLCFGVLMATVGATVELTATAVVLGAAAATLVPDLRERMMLGDTGANVLGGVLGLAVVLSCGSTTRWAVALGLVALNAAAEVVSFSRVIDAVPPLRFVDRLGRLEVSR